MFLYKVGTRPDVLLLDLHWGFFDVHTTKDVRSTIFHQGLSGVAGGRVAEVLDCDQKGPRFQPTTSRPFSSNIENVLCVLRQPSASLNISLTVLLVIANYMTVSIVQFQTEVLVGVCLTKVANLVTCTC